MKQKSKNENHPNRKTATINSKAMSQVLMYTLASRQPYWFTGHKNSDSKLANILTSFCFLFYGFLFFFFFFFFFYSPEECSDDRDEDYSAESDDGRDVEPYYVEFFDYNDDEVWT